jgi:hypothetical protein
MSTAVRIERCFVAGGLQVAGYLHHDNREHGAATHESVHVIPTAIGLVLEV